MTTLTAKDAYELATKDKFSDKTIKDEVNYIIYKIHEAASNEETQLTYRAITAGFTRFSHHVIKQLVDLGYTCTGVDTTTILISWDLGEADRRPDANDSFDSALEIPLSCTREI